MCAAGQELLGIGAHFGSWVVAAGADGGTAAGALGHHATASPLAVPPLGAPLLVLSTETVARAGAAVRAASPSGGSDGDDGWRPLDAAGVERVVRGLVRALGAKEVEVRRLLAALRIRNRSGHSGDGDHGGAVNASAVVDQAGAVVGAAGLSCYAEAMEALWERMRRWDGVVVMV